MDYFGVPPFPRMEQLMGLLGRSGIGTVVLSRRLAVSAATTGELGTAVT